MFLRLNRADSTMNIFNLDNIANIWADNEMIAMEFIDGKHFAFTKKCNPEEYELLKQFFENKLDAYTIPNYSLNLGR